MNENRYASSDAIMDLLNTPTHASSRERTAAILVAFACLGAIVAALILIGRFLPVFS
jgi:hypothetical protein